MSFIHNAKGSLITKVSLLLLTFSSDCVRPHSSCAAMGPAEMGYSQVQNGFPCYWI